MKYHFLPNFSNRSLEGLVTLPCRGRAVAAYMASSYVGLRVSLGMALVALIIVALAENGRIPVDNPATVGFNVAHTLHSVRVMGHDRPGIAAELTQKLADGRINLRGFSASVIGTQFLSYAAVDSLDDANKVMEILGKA